MFHFFSKIKGVEEMLWDKTANADTIVIMYLVTEAACPGQGLDCGLKLLQ